MDRERALQELVGKLQRAYADLLVSVVLYGSAAAGDSDRFSDLNILCVLRRLSVAELAASEPVFRWWRDLGNPAPLLFDESELRTATDCFPIEFHDIKERHKILHGADVVAGLEIDDIYYRAEVEHDLRAKLLRLRQKAGALLSDKELLLRLMVDSVSTFAVLSRHALRLAGAGSLWQKPEIVEAAAARFAFDPSPFLTLLEVRDGKRKPKEVDTTKLFEQYLREIGTLVQAVDRLKRDGKGDNV